MYNNWEDMPGEMNEVWVCDAFISLVCFFVMYYVHASNFLKAIYIIKHEPYKCLIVTVKVC